MAHFAKITFDGDGKEYTILDIDYDLDKTVGTNGQVTGYPKCGTIRLNLVSPDDEDMFFFTWMKSTTEHKDGTIEFEVVNDGKKSVKKMDFEGAQCTHLKENFNFFNDSQMLLTVSFVAKKVSFGDGAVTFENF